MRTALLAVKVYYRLQISVVIKWLTDKVKVDEIGVDDFVARFSQVKQRTLGSVSRNTKGTNYVLLGVCGNPVLLLEKVILHSD